jgi:hypothetical protein
MPRNIDTINDTNHNEVGSNLLLNIIKLNEEISKSKNLLFLDSTMGINFSALDFEFLNTRLNELYPNSITENIYLF